jgi:hypothetical protein
MNRRIESDDTLEGTLAAVAWKMRLLAAKKYRETGGQHTPPEPDYADFREAFRPYVRCWEIRARIDQARKTSAKSLTEIVEELARDLGIYEKECEIQNRERFGL